MVRAALATMLTVLAALAAGCRPASETARAQVTPPAASQSSLRDWVARPLPLEAGEGRGGPQRIVSAAPNVTEICWALGLGPRLVARTRFCQYPPEVRRIPAFGALNDLSAEALLAVRPDLILVAGESRLQVERLQALGLRYETVPDRSLADLFAAIRRIGELTDRPRTARRLCEAIEADLRAVDARYADVPPQRVLLLIGTLADPPRPPYVAGPGSFYDDLLRRAGHRNIAGDGHAAFGPLSLEYIVRADPDVIIELDADGSARPGGAAQARRIWAQVGPLKAVRTGRLRVLSGQEHFLLGPRIARLYEALCAAIAPPEAGEREP